jgi:hypothetical protein
MSNISSLDIHNVITTISSTETYSADSSQQDCSCDDHDDDDCDDDDDDDRIDLGTFPVEPKMQEKPLLAF